MEPRGRMCVIWVLVKGPDNKPHLLILVCKRGYNNGPVIMETRIFDRVSFTVLIIKPSIMS